MGWQRDHMKQEALQRNGIWTFTTYFSEGFPFVIIRTVSGVFLRDMKVSLEGIGLTPLYGLPWILKFLWGPQVDEYSSKRRWMLGMQSALFFVFLMAAIFAPLSINVPAIAVLFFLGSILAATHDIAIDGYYMEALDPEGQAKYVGHRVMAYRIAMMTGTAVIVTVGTHAGWGLAFFMAAFIFGLFLLYHLLFLKEVETIEAPVRTLLRRALKTKTMAGGILIVLVVLALRAFFQSEIYTGLVENIPLLGKIRFPHWIALALLTGLVTVGLLRNKIKAVILRDPDSYYSKAFLMFMEREKISIILPFIIFLRGGEWTLTTMVAPFIVDLGIKKHYGWISGLVGLPMAVVGAMLGGWLISRYGMKRTIWPFILAQNITNLIYMGLAAHLSRFLALNTQAAATVPLGGFNLALIGCVHGFDQFASGLGNALLMTYLMRICHPHYKAAHYAIGSGLMNVSGLFTGVMSGFVAGWLGYAWLFGLSFLVSVPAMVLIPFLPYLERNHPPASS